ncbi:hypothetical protein [Streptomyces sp. NBC_01237]|uniref:hypothetical protein n=1 Tax=Streptomyces sp. NBC_01237 TaxID=2903790 RepID=UPI002DD7EA07|nr:hypothetical protein [Streptomyces sp. NBC_01237]WRZ73896.1 hypothetical protein OG251_20940 [Streptomyces sp. NBC_01237]
MAIRIGNVTIEDSDNNGSGDDLRQAMEAGGAVINGGHFGGQDNGISGGVFHGRVHVGNSND